MAHYSTVRAGSIDRLLVVRFGAFGDMVLMTPMLRRLRQRFGEHTHATVLTGEIEGRISMMGIQAHTVVDAWMNLVSFALEQRCGLLGNI